MAVYDPESKEDQDKKYSPEELAEQEKLAAEREEAEAKERADIASGEEGLRDRYGSGSGDLRSRIDSGLGRHGKLRDKSLDATAREEAALNDRLQQVGKGFRKEDEEAGFFKPEKDKKKQKGVRQRLNRFRKSRRNMMIAGGLVTTLVAGLLGLFSFLNTFRLDHILNSLDQQTFARFNASFEGRSDAWFRSYLRIRLAEIDGRVNPADDDSNLYFRSNRVDNDNPVKDWYRTLRTSRFEDDLLKNHGIRFTSAIDAQGNIRPAMIEIGERRRVDIDVGSLRGQDGLANFNNFLNQIDGEFDAKIYGSDREARRAIRLAVNDNTKSYQFFRRRHLRKDIRNMTGVRDWRLFEKTRDRTRNAKIDIQRKIINKVFSGEANSLKFINCLLGGTRCPNTSDPVDPENKATATPDGSLPDGEGDDRVQVDENGRPLEDEDGNPLRGNQGDAIARETSEAVAEAAADQESTQNLNRRITRAVVDRVARLVGRGPNIWEWAKRLTSIHNLFDGGASSQVVKLIKNARMQQLVGFYAAMGIARDQMRSGELVNDEVGPFYEMTRNFSNSEAWAALGDSYDRSVASAQSTDDDEPVDKETYCRSDYQRSFEEYAYYCDHFKPNGGSNGQRIAEVYDSTVGWIIAPIAAAVNGVDDSFLGSIINAFGNAVGNLVAVFGDIGMAALNLIGLGDNIESAIGTAVAGIIDFVGAAPFIDPASPGFASWIFGGSVGTAETSARASGGVASTPVTYEYSKKLARQHQQDKLASMTWSERYLSPDNPRSPVAKLAFAASGIVAGENPLYKFVANFANAPSALASVFTRPVFAQTPETSLDLALVAGVDTYDIHPNCMALDPLDPNYEQKATNANIPDKSFEFLADEDRFWEAVYENDQPVDREQIYNCMLLDERVAGSSGARYGYTKDGGYPETAQPAAITTSDSNGQPVIGNTVDTACAPGTTDLGPATGYSSRQPYEIRLCGIPGFESRGSEDDEGIVRVNSTVSGAWLQLFQQAQNAGITLKANSSFRSNEAQTALYNCYRANSCSEAAPPGTSNHQMGFAVDIDINASGSDPRLTTCQANPAAYPTYQWLAANAPALGMQATVASECWHWASGDG